MLKKTKQELQQEHSLPVLTTTAAAGLAWLARSLKTEWPSVDLEAPFWPASFTEAARQLFPERESLDATVWSDTARFLAQTLPRETWLADDILGTVYEFSNESSDGRRDTGQYYTPAWLVDILVGLSLSTLHYDLETCPRQPRTRLRVLDPACGCGAFLLRAARLGEMAVGMRAGPEGETSAMQVPTMELFGLDIDREALSLARASFALLNISVGRTLEVSAARLLQGDFLDRRSGHPLGAEESQSVSMKQGQPSACAGEGGFDIALGNPPYLGFHRYSSDYRKKVLRQYSVFDGKADIFYYFIERGLECLREGGVLGYVVPRYWLAADRARRLRRYLADEAEPAWLVDMNGLRTFGRTEVQVCILVMRKRHPGHSSALRVVQLSSREEASEFLNQLRSGDGPKERHARAFTVEQKCLGETWVLAPSAERAIMSEMEAAADSPLGKLASVSPGLITGADRTRRSKGDGRGGIFVLSQDELEALNLLPIEQEVVKPWLKNSHVLRWRVLESEQSLLYVTSPPDPHSMPNLHKHLKRFRRILEARYEVVLSKRPWWSLIRPREKEQFDPGVPKIVVPFKAIGSKFAVDYGNHYCSADVYCINPGADLLPEYLCCLLNSRLLEFYLKRIAKRMGQLYELYSHTLVRVPIKLAPVQVQAEFKRLHDQITTAYRLHDSENEIASTVSDLERQIDELVFELYGIRRDPVIFGGN